MICRLLLLFTLLIALTGCSSRPANPTVESVTLSADPITNAARPPVSAERLPQTTKSIHLLVRLKGHGSGTRVEARWSHDHDHNGRYSPIGTAEVTFKSGKDHHVQFHLTVGDAFPPGSYRVELYIDEKLAREQRFTLE